ncbi:cbl-interacting protein kinase 24 [Phtheirospermum japonicum]|uniref:non-specific serine/threonine protein kinase n=1 Tax=Phtheirospermum japonicum TaxID=374723 RepID=A0A830DAV0_9LAMI|nr:cbl-interacting protein kinase 24 [Phtheirospermum japonicum]
MIPDCVDQKKKIISDLIECDVEVLVFVANSIGGCFDAGRREGEVREGNEFSDEMKVKEKYGEIEGVHHGRLSENESRRYFQQLIDAVSHCHSKGVYHRDLKPENLLLDSKGNLKVSDFGLSALPQQGVDLLHTTCGTPNYVAPEFLHASLFPFIVTWIVVQFGFWDGYGYVEWHFDWDAVHKGIGLVGTESDEEKMRLRNNWLKNVKLKSSSMWGVGLDRHFFKDKFDLDRLPSARWHQKATVKLGVEDIYSPTLGRVMTSEDYSLIWRPSARWHQVLSHRGYDGAAADIWSCGVILYVLMAGYLPFDESDLPSLYNKINAAQFSCPFWFSPAATSLIHKILDPNPESRVKIGGIRKDPWFQKNYVPVRPREDELVTLDDVRAVFDDIEDKFVNEESKNNEDGPLIMNAFEMITLSQGLNLSALFDRRQVWVEVM